MPGTSIPINGHGTNLDESSVAPAIDQTPIVKPPLSDCCPSETFTLASSDRTGHDPETSLSPHANVPLDGSQIDVPRSLFVPRSEFSTKILSSPHGPTTPRRSVISLIHSPGYATPTSEHTRSASKRRTSNATGLAKDSHPQGLLCRTGFSRERRSQASAERHSVQNGKLITKRESYLLRQYKAPLNPRDHTILETIYAETLASRFINTSPLSIIQNYLEYHFIGESPHLVVAGLANNFVRCPNTSSAATHLPTYCFVALGVTICGRFRN